MIDLDILLKHERWFCYHTRFEIVVKHYDNSLESEIFTKKIYNDNQHSLTNQNKKNVLIITKYRLKTWNRITNFKKFIYSFNNQRYFWKNKHNKSWFVSMFFWKYVFYRSKFWTRFNKSNKNFVQWTFSFYT